jgi:hypothetical protein
MTMNRAVRWLVGVAAAATISIGVAAPVGSAQTAGDCAVDPSYCPVPVAPSGSTSPTESTALARKKCIVKAKAKFGDNAVKRKKAIKKCKKKFR